MLQFASKKLTCQLLRNNIIDPAMTDIYEYGFELTLSTLLTSSAILLIACLLDSFFFGLLYFAISIPLRMTAGGYHASTYGKCFVISNVTYFAVSFLARLLARLMLPYPVWLVLLFGCIFYILANCPVKNPHHPVSDSVLKKNRRITILFSCFLCFLMVFLYFILQYSYMLNFIVITVLSIAVLILPTKRKG